MNDETRRLQEMLERATALGDEVPEDLDAETASLREGWLAFGKLLTDAQPAAGEAWENWQVTPRPVQRRRSLGLALAVAASLLIAAGLTTAYRLLEGSSGVLPNPPTIAQDNRVPAGTVEESPAAIPQPDAETRQDLQIAAVPDQLEWDDSLDKQITAVAQAAALAREDWSPGRQLKRNRARAGRNQKGHSRRHFVSIAATGDETMTGRKSILLGTVSLVPYLLAFSWASAQNAGAKPKPGVQPKPDASDVVGDDFRPLLPSAKPDDRGPRGPQDFGRPGGPPGQGPGMLPGLRPGGKPRERPGGQLGEGGPGMGLFDRPGPPGGFRPGDASGGMGLPSGPGPQLGPPRWPHGDWPSLEQNDPEMYKLLQADYSLDRQSQELAIQYRHAPKDQREAIKQKLEKSVAEHFEARQQRRLLELKRLEEELKRLRDSIDKRKEGQAQIINRRVSELLGLQDEPQF